MIQTCELNKLGHLIFAVESRDYNTLAVVRVDVSPDCTFEGAGPREFVPADSFYELAMFLCTAQVEFV